ncbi:MAG TPA: hypothetical protein VFI73_10265 [Candidatus Nitrosopolaris sp.]|nr:hypothetical protein [Candidatus Nitrosopolaris sp.]
MHRGYLILIIGGALLTSGIAIAVIWAGSLGGGIIHQNTILNGLSIYPSGTADAITQVNDLSRPLSLVISIESNHNTGQTNPTLKEIVRNPNGEVISANEFSSQFLTTIKPDVIGKYTLTIDNIGGSLVSVGILFGNLPFVDQNNQLNINLFAGLVAGGILAVVGIVALIVGLILVIVNRQRSTRNSALST